MNEIVRQSRQFISALRLHMRQAWFYKTAVMAVVVSWSLRMGMTIALYYGIYQVLKVDEVKGLSFQIAGSSMVLYAILSGFGARDVYRIINHEFKTGGIGLWLNKPVNYVVFKMAENLGKNIPNAVTLLAVGMVFWMLTGFPEVDHTVLRITYGAILAMGGLVIGYLLYTIVGMSAVWLQEAQAVFQSCDKVVMVFGGAYIPIAFYPPFLRLIGESLPMGAMFYMSQLFYPDFLANVLRFMMMQVFWIVALGFAVRYMMRAMNRHLAVNGG